MQIIFRFFCAALSCVLLQHQFGQVYNMICNTVCQIDRIFFLQKCTPQIEKYANCVFNKSNAQFLCPLEIFPNTKNLQVNISCFNMKAIGDIIWNCYKPNLFLSIITLVESFPNNSLRFFPWTPYLKTDCTSLLILFSVNRLVLKISKSYTYCLDG